MCKHIGLIQGPEPSTSSRYMCSAPRQLRSQCSARVNNIQSLHTCDDPYCVVASLSEPRAFHRDVTKLATNLDHRGVKGWVQKWCDSRTLRY